MYAVALASLLSVRRQQKATGRQSHAASADPLAKGSVAGDPVQSGTRGAERGHEGWVTNDVTPPS